MRRRPMSVEPHLRDRHILIVEDEYMIALSLAMLLEKRGATVVGPAGSVAEAMSLLDAGTRLDAAVLDINLGREKAYPIADALAARAVPFIFTTGYDASAIPAPYAQVPRCEKPVMIDDLVDVLSDC